MDASRSVVRPASADAGELRKIGNPMTELASRYSLNSRELNSLIRPLRQTDNSTNFRYLAIDYASIALVIGPAVAFLEWRESWGLFWGWNIPVVALAVLLVGALQHRLAGLGHEGAHYILFRNRWLNELVSNLFCMYPIFATTDQYRLVHLAHHQFTNDWHRDPDLMHIGTSKLMDRFPMSRADFVQNYFIRFLWPPVLLRYLGDVLYLSVLGQGESPYARRATRGLRCAGVLGLAYFVGMIGVLALLSRLGNGGLLVAGALGCWLAASAVTFFLPDRAFFQSPLSPTIPKRLANSIRLGYYTLLLASFAFLRWWTGRNWGDYFLLLWVLPLVSSFAYFMLLRDVYQHANADDGRLTNSRVFFCDPFTRWAVFVYGMDIHIPHHMYPAVPHYRLLELHQLLKARCPEYARTVVECEGTFGNRSGKPTILSVMAPAGEEVESPSRRGYPSALDGEPVTLGRGVPSIGRDGWISS